MAILDFFQNSIPQPFDEVQGSNSEYKLISHRSITGSPFGNMAAILDFYQHFFTIKKNFHQPGAPKGPIRWPKATSPLQELERGSYSDPNLYCIKN